MRTSIITDDELLNRIMDTMKEKNVSQAELFLHLGRTGRRSTHGAEIRKGCISNT